MPQEKRQAFWRKFDDAGWFIGQEVVELLESKFQQRNVTIQRGRNAGKVKQVLGDLIEVNVRRHDGTTIVLPIESLKFGVPR